MGGIIVGSTDILYLVIAFCVLLLTIMCCFLLYYFIVIVKRAKEMTDLVKLNLRKTMETVETLKKKIESSTAIFSILAETLKHVIDFLKDRKEAKKSKREKKEKD